MAESLSPNKYSSAQRASELPSLLAQLNVQPESHYSFRVPRPQAFCLPYEMMEIITRKNTNPLVYTKLISTCKHFFAKSHLHMVDDVVFDNISPFQYKITYKKENIFLRNSFVRLSIKKVSFNIICLLQVRKN